MFIPQAGNVGPDHPDCGNAESGLGLRCQQKTKAIFTRLDTNVCFLASQRLQLVRLFFPYDARCESVGVIKQRWKLHGQALF